MNPDSQSDRRLMPRKSAAIRRKAVHDAAPRSRVAAGEPTTRVRARVPEPATRARASAEPGTRARATAGEPAPRSRGRSASKAARLRDDFRSYARVAILSAAEEVLAEEGLHSARIEEIAQRARVAVGTIDNLVGDRDALVAEIMCARHAEIVTLLASTLKSHEKEPFRDQTHSVVLAMFRYFSSHWRFFRLVVDTEQGAAAGGGKLRAAARGKHATLLEIHELMRELVSRGVKRGALRATGSEIYPVMLSGLMRAVMLHDLTNQDRSSPEARANEVTRMFLEGAGT
jgi:AcrR family transcriptional regulator